VFFFFFNFIHLFNLIKQIPGPFVLGYFIYIEIETNLAHAGLNSDHVKF